MYEAYLSFTLSFQIKEGRLVKPTMLVEGAKASGRARGSRIYKEGIEAKQGRVRHAGGVRQDLVSVELVGCLEADHE